MTVVVEIQLNLFIFMISNLNDPIAVLPEFIYYFSLWPSLSDREGLFLVPEIC